MISLSIYMLTNLELISLDIVDIVINLNMVL